MRWGPCIFALSAAGCAQLAGIDNTSDDNRLGVSLDVDRISIGTTVISTPQDLSANTAEYLVPDAMDPTRVTIVPAVQIETGVWAADIDVTPPIRFDLPEVPGPPLRRLWTFPVADMLAGFEVREHPNPTPADGASMFTIKVGLERPFSVETFELFVVGAWANRALDPPALMGEMTLAPVPFAMSTLGSLVGRPTLDKITTADAALVLRRTGTKLDGTFEALPFDQTASDMLTGSITPVPLIDTLDIIVDPAAIANRISASNPDVNAPTFSWELDASPGADKLATTLGPRLESGSVTVETAVQTTYGNPFEQKWPTTFTFRANASRSTTPDPALPPITLSAGMVQIENKPTMGQAIDFPVRFPQLISINGIALSLDNQISIAAPTASVEVSVVTDNNDKAASLFEVDVIEIAPDAGNTVLEQHRVLAAFGTDPKILLPADVFQAGKRYVLRSLVFSGGFPNAAQGDLRTHVLPIRVAFLDSGVFQVTP